MKKINEDEIKNYNSPRFLPALGLILLFYASAAGQYLESLEKFDMFTANILGFISTIIATIIMLFYPFILRLVEHKQIPYKKCRKACIANSIILLIISLVLQVIFEIGFIGGIGAWIYYYINMFLFSERKEFSVDEQVEEKPYYQQTIVVEDYFIPNPALSDEENLKEHFSKMDINALKNLVENRKDEYVEDAYNIAVEQYNLRHYETENIYEQAKLKEDIATLNEALSQLTQMLSQAKKDLGNLTVEDVENMYRQKLITETQKNEMINSIEILQTTIAMTPTNIEGTKKSIAELEEKLKKLQEA